MYSKKMKYRVIGLVILAMLLQIILPAAKNVYAAIPEDGNDLGNIFTSVILKVDDIGVEPGTPIEIKDTMEIFLHYTWSIDDEVELESDDYAVIEIPSFFTDYFGVEHTGDISSDSYGKVGTYKIYKNQFTLIFDETLVGKKAGQALLVLGWNSILRNLRKM